MLMVLQQLLWTGDPYAPELKKNSDIKYAGELLDHIESSFCVDKSRIYALGFSNGGGLANLLACDPILSSRIAAVAIASGAFFRGTPVKPDTPFNPKHCKPSRSPIPIVEFHGADDDMIAYDGHTLFEGPTYAITGWLKKWAERNGCEFDKGEKVMLNNGRVSKYNWECGGSDKPILQHYLLHGIGHTWPAVPMPASDAEDEDPNFFDGTSIMKKFFEAHELPGNDESGDVSSDTKQGENEEEIFEAEFDYAEARRAAEKRKLEEKEKAAESEDTQGEGTEKVKEGEERLRDEL
jgi:poly(3-hydroxybutyrate) depolymerase